jgi:hypothetical protein
MHPAYKYKYNKELTFILELNPKILPHSFVARQEKALADALRQWRSCRKVRAFIYCTPRDLTRSHA